MSECLRLSLWSGPRNISTALMYAFRQRSDTRVVDEPLYGHYLRVTGAEHPGAREVLEAVDCDGERVVRETLLGPCERPVLFAKNMAHHLVGLEHDFWDSLTNLLLTRDPHAMLSSLVKQIPNPTLRDTGLEYQVKILEREVANGRVPVVLEASEVLKNPTGVLTAACERLGLPFEDSMLSWPARFQTRRRCVGTLLVRPSSRFDRLRALSAENGGTAETARAPTERMPTLLRALERLRYQGFRLELTAACRKLASSIPGSSSLWPRRFRGTPGA